MSLESKFEEFRFQNRVLAEHIDIRTQAIISRAQELDAQLKDDLALKKHFDSIKEAEKDLPGNNVDELLSLIYLACKRSVGEEWDILGTPYQWDLIPREVQIKAGIVLCDDLDENKFIRARTGEGKTLISLFPLAYHSMLGKVHSITSNDYLAARDQEWIGPILEKLGITTAFLPKEEDKKSQAYTADIVFGSDKEFSFDFLRDSIRQRGKPKLCSERDYALVDEADHVMLDELKTPIVLSSITEDYDPAVPIAGEAIELLLEKQKTSVESLKKGFAKGFSNQKEYLKTIVQLKYSGLADEWLDRLFSHNPKLVSELQNFEHAYLKGMAFFSHIESDLYFTVNTKKQGCALTDKGMEEIEKNYPIAKELFEIPDYEALRREVRESGFRRYHKSRKLKDLSHKEGVHFGFLAALQQALVANMLLVKDVDYIITEEGKVSLVNPSTGRAEPSKKYQKGLSQAVEYKENLLQTEVDIVVTSTTFPGLLSNYKRLCAMSGTIAPNQKELKKLYDMESFDIPTNVPPIARHSPTKLYPTKKEKRASILEQILWNHSLGRPILIGCNSVKASEEIAKLLDENNIQYALLNAKNEAKEAKIVANAGELNAVTISTNMAGRGTDIKIDEKVNQIIAENYVSAIQETINDYSEIQITSYSEEEHNLLLSALKQKPIPVVSSKKRIGKYVTLLKGSSQKQNKTSMDFNAGLYVIGEELGESERNNSQLRGRTGRQGQPGSSQFYISLESEIVKNSGISSWFGRKVIQNNTFDYLKAIAKGLCILFAQETGENNAEYSRSENLFYGSIVETQRKLTSEFRESVSDSLPESLILAMIDSVILGYANDSFKSRRLEEKEFENFKYLVEQTFNTNISSLEYNPEELAYEPEYKQQIVKTTKPHIMGLYSKRKTAFGTGNNEINADIMNDVLDRNWLVQMETLESLKESARLQAYADHLPPRNVYAKLAYQSFQDYRFNIMKDFSKELFNNPLPQELVVRQKAAAVSEELGELLR